MCVLRCYLSINTNLLHIHGGISASERPLASLGAFTVVAAAAVAADPTAPAVGWPARASACPADGSTRPTPGCSLADLSMDLWSVLQTKSPSGRLELLKEIMPQVYANTYMTDTQLNGSGPTERYVAHYSGEANTCVAQF